jgi:hypothetical protein
VEDSNFQEYGCHFTAAGNGGRRRKLKEPGRNIDAEKKENAKRPPVRLYLVGLATQEIRIVLPVL